MTNDEIAKNFDEMATEFYFDNQFFIKKLVAYLAPNEDGKDSFVKNLRPTKKNLALFDAISTSGRFYKIIEKSYIKDMTANPSRADELIGEFYEETKQFMKEFSLKFENLELKAVA